MPTIKYHPDAVPWLFIYNLQAITIELNEEQLRKCQELIISKPKNKELRQICKSLDCRLRGEDNNINKAGMLMNIVIKYIFNVNDCMSIKKSTRRLLWEWICDTNFMVYSLENGAERTPTTITE